MPSHRQRTVNIDVTPRSLGPIGGLSTSDTTELNAIYPASPIHSGQLTPEERKKFYQDNVLDAAVNDGGHTFGTFDTSYTDAPDMAEVDVRANNLPSPYVPNPVSPGPGLQVRHMDLASDHAFLQMQHQSEHQVRHLVITS